MANDVTIKPTSPAYGGNAFRLANITNVDGTTVNSIVLGGFPSDTSYTPTIVYLNVWTSNDNSGTKQASYASVDIESLVYDAAAQTVALDIYVKGGAGTIVDIFVVA